MEISGSSIISFSIILIIGVLTVISDLQRKKIYNDHLVIGAVLGLAAIIYAGLWAHEKTLFHMINGLAGLVIGLIFYRSDLWRGGDAKLFTLYAFLMPPLQSGQILFSSTINLFACSFIAGAIIIIPFFIKNIASNYNAVINELMSREKSKNLFNAVRITIFCSWVIFPVYYFIKIIQVPALSLAVTYLIFNLAHRFLRKINSNHLITGCGIAFGLLTRLWLSPHSSSWPVLIYSILKIGLFSVLSACIYATLDLLKEHHDRVPFAPLLFTGCVLSYTPFLTMLIRLVTRCNALLYR